MITSGRYAPHQFLYKKISSTGLLGRVVKYKILNFLYIFSCRSSPTSQTRCQIFTWCRSRKLRDLPFEG